MRSFTTTAAILGAVLLAGCASTNSDPSVVSNGEPQSTDATYTLIGKQARLTFPEMTADVSYKSETTLHWKAVDKKGAVSEGDEQLFYQRLDDHLHFLNWIEKDGWTVSQIIDTRKGTVKAFWSFADEKSPRGKRTPLFVDGKFEFVK
jgi:hypothetical protein